MPAQFITEAAATLGRRSRGKTEDVWLQSPLYPEYYRTFHYQARPRVLLHASCPCRGPIIFRFPSCVGEGLARTS